MEQHNTSSPTRPPREVFDERNQRGSATMMMVLFSRKSSRAVVALPATMQEAEARSSKSCRLLLPCVVLLLRKLGRKAGRMAIFLRASTMTRLPRLVR